MDESLDIQVQKSFSQTAYSPTSSWETVGVFQRLTTTLISTLVAFHFLPPLFQEPQLDLLSMP